MNTLYLQCIYNEDEKCWIVAGVYGPTNPNMLEAFTKGLKGIGENLELAIADWKDAMLIGGLQAQQKDF